MADSIKKFGDAVLAEHLIKAYAERENTFAIEFEELGISWNGAKVLHDILDVELITPYGRDFSPAISPEEREYLSRNGFSDEFIHTLAGPDGKRALKARLKWIFDHRPPASFIELRNMGPDAREFLPILVAEMKQSLGWTIHDTLPIDMETLARIEPDPYAMAYYFSTVCFNAEGSLPHLVAGLMSDDETIKKCSATAVNTILKFGRGIPDIPSSGIPLLRQAYLRLADDHETRLHLIKLAGCVNPPTDELLDFLGTVMRKEENSLIIDEAEQLFDRYGRASIPVVIHLMGDQVRSWQWAAGHLWGLGLTAENMPSLLQAMKQSLTAENNLGLEDLRCRLRHIGDETALEELQRFYKEGDLNQKKLALMLLKEFQQGRDYLLPEFLDALGHPDPLLARVARGEIRNNRSSEFWFSLLAPHLQSSNPFLRRRATEMVTGEIRNFELGWPHSSEIVVGLIYNLESGDPVMRKISARALGRMGEQAKLALPILLTIRTGDPVESCRIAAREAIEKIEEKVL